MTNDVIFIILLVAVAGLALLLIPQWRLKRAIPRVIRAFREHNANNIKAAKTIDELGLRPRGFMEGLLKGRDYRQYALSALLKAGIVQGTGDGRFYLSEDRLATSSLEKKKPISRF